MRLVYRLDAYDASAHKWKIVIPQMMSWDIVKMSRRIVVVVRGMESGDPAIQCFHRTGDERS